MIPGVRANLGSGSLRSAELALAWRLLTGAPNAFLELAVAGDEIVVDRTWRCGVEIVSRVNWSHIARVRNALGLLGDSLGTDAPAYRRRLVRVLPTLVPTTGAPVSIRAA